MHGERASAGGGSATQVVGRATPADFADIATKLEPRSHSVLISVPAAERPNFKEMIVKTRLFAPVGGRFAKFAVLLFCSSLTFPALAQVGSMEMVPAAAVSSIAPLPKGVKVLARVPLAGSPITRMYTQREYGHTFLYIEHGKQSLTTVDVSKKRNPRIVDHAPAQVEAVRYEPLYEGGSIENWPRHVTAGVDNVGGLFSSVLEGSNPNDAKLLQVFVAENSNLVDRDSGLVYFASRSQLLIVQDDRPTAYDLTNYTSN